VLGAIAEILETGANDVFIVRNETGDEVLLPAIESVIRDVDLERGKVIVYLLPGLLPNKTGE
jgi:16S rRNA processing protein RimM